MPPKKHRGRPPAHAAVLPNDYPGPTTKDGKPAMKEKEWTACVEFLDQVYRSKDGSRRMSDIFRELPNKDDYPDYYDSISDPECLDNIARGLGEQRYATAEDFFKRLHLVFLNAKIYNEEESLVHEDARRFETVLYDQWKKRVQDGVFPAADPYHREGGRPRPAHIKDEPVSSTPKISLRVPKLPDSSPGSAAVQPASAPVVPPETPKQRPQRAAAQAAAAAMSPQHAIAAPRPNTLLSDNDLRIVDATDRKLPRWEGPKLALPGDPAPGGVLGSGWWGEAAPEYERSVGGQASWKRRIRSVAEAIAEYKDSSGARLSDTFGAMPPVVDLPYLSFHTSLAFSTILVGARGNNYSTLRDFDLDMTRLFEKARRWFPRESKEYGNILTLQRLYNALTAPYPLSLPPNGIPGPSITRFASMAVGPGRARGLQETSEAIRAGAKEEEIGHLGILTSRVGSKDRLGTDEARHKGVAYRTGDFVHLINPDDPSRPIVGQIFKTFVPTKGYVTHHVTVCWYFRPNQTIHPGEQTFVENEVFKSPHFCDHPVEDIIERVSVQPTEGASRGRPRPGLFFPGWPIYACSARYLDKAALFIRIKKWATIMPEPSRGVDYHSVIPFERAIHLATIKSPFLMGIPGPGQLGRPRRQPMPQDDEEEEAALASGVPRTTVQSVQHIGTTRPIPVNQTIPSQAGYPFSQQRGHPQQQQYAPGPSRTPHVQQVQVHQTQAHAQQQYHQQQSQQPHQRRPSTQAVQGQAAAWQRAPPAVPQHLATRTFTSVMGGQQVLDSVAVKEYLPAETAKLFEQDARHQVLWFSAPPIPQGVVKLPQPQPHSLEYLTYLSKRKRGISAKDARPSKRLAHRAVSEEAVGSADEDADGEPDEEMPAAKTEGIDGDLSRHWWAEGQNAEQVWDSLKALVAK